MRIGIDIDGTITNTIEFIRDLKKKEYPDYGYNELLPSDLYIKFLDKYRFDIYKNVKLKDYVKESFRRLNEMNFKIIIITGRPVDSKNMTLEFLSQNNLTYDEIYFEINEKGKLAKKLDIDLFIDDHLFICDQMQQNNIPVIKIKRDDEENKNYIAFDNWYDIMEYIEHMKEENNG